MKRHVLSGGQTPEETVVVCISNGSIQKGLAGKWHDIARVPYTPQVSREGHAEEFARAHLVWTALALVCAWLAASY